MEKEIKCFEREELFNYYDKRNNPFLIITTPIDITKIYLKCKTYYASIGYFICLAANSIDNFKYRYDNGSFYKCHEIKPSFVDMWDDKNIGFFCVDIKDKYSNFINEYKKNREIFLSTKKSYSDSDINEVWLSCVPWYKVTSVIPPFDKSITIPQFIWDKFELKDDRCYINLMIMVHHGFVDGYHISLFLKKLNEIIENLDDYLN